MVNGSSEQWESMWKATISGWQGCLNVLIRRQLGQTAKGRDGRRWMQHTLSNSFHVFTSDLICTCAHRNVVNTVTQKNKTPNSGTVSTDGAVRSQIWTFLSCNVHSDSHQCCDTDGWATVVVYLLVVTIWLELCRSYSSSCHQHPVILSYNSI